MVLLMLCLDFGLAWLMGAGLTVYVRLLLFVLFVFVWFGIWVFSY